MHDEIKRLISLYEVKHAEMIEAMNAVVEAATWRDLGQFFDFLEENQAKLTTEGKWYSLKHLYDVMSHALEHEEAKDGIHEVSGHRSLG
jgi:hypothetical protein